VYIYIYMCVCVCVCVCVYIYAMLSVNKFKLKVNDNLLHLAFNNLLIILVVFSILKLGPNVSSAFYAQKI